MKTIADWRTVEYTNLETITYSRAPLWLQQRFLEMMRAEVVSRIRAWRGPDRPTRRVVDLGCGNGEWTLSYLDLAPEVIGLDVNPSFIQYARRLAAMHPRAGAVSFAVTNMTEYVEPEGTDLVCLGACVQYLDDRQLDGLLERLASRLAPGASLYLRSTVAAPLRPARRTDWGHYRTATYYEERLRRFGFNLDDRFRTSTVLPAAAVTRLLGVSSFRAARAIAAPFWLAHAAWRSLARRDDYMNWFFTRAVG